MKPKTIYVVMFRCPGYSNWTLDKPFVYKDLAEEHARDETEDSQTPHKVFRYRLSAQ